MKLSKITTIFSLWFVLISINACGPKEKSLIDKLGAKKYKDREQAQKEILERGASYIDSLFKYKNHKELEIRKRINTIIPIIFKQVTESKSEDLQKNLDHVKKNHKNEFNKYLYDRLEKVLDIEDAAAIAERANIIKILLKCDKDTAVKIIFEYFKEGKLSFTAEEEKQLYLDITIPHLVAILQSKGGLKKRVLSGAMQHLGKIFTLKSQQALVAILKDTNLKDDRRIGALYQLQRLVNFLNEELEGIMLPQGRRAAILNDLSKLKKELTAYKNSPNGKKFADEIDNVLQQIKD